jgi:hypothetical protein
MGSTQTNMENNTFIKWMLGITATLVTTIGAGLMVTIMTLREDMAVIKTTVARIERSEITARALEEKVVNHEYRIRTIERSTTTIDTIRNRWRNE